MAEVCKIGHELSAKFLMANQGVARQVARMSRQITELDNMAKLTDNVKVKQSLNAAKAFEQAKVETYMLAAMASGQNKALYIDSLLELYGKSSDLTEGILTIQSLQDMLGSGVRGFEDLKTLFGTDSPLEEQLDKLQSGLLQRMAYDYSYADKFGLQKFVDNVTDAKAIKNAAKDLAKGLTTDEIVAKYNNNDELFLQIMEKTQDGETGLINYIIARSVFNGTLPWGTIPKELYTMLGLRTMSDDALMNAMNLTPNKITQKGLEKLQYLFITNMDAFMNSKTLYDKLQATITRVVTRNASEGDIQMIEAWRTLQKQITSANVPGINANLSKKIALQKLNAIGKATPKTYNAAIELIRKYAADPLSQRNIGSVTIKTGRVKEKVFTRSNIWELIGILGIDEIINNKIDIDGLLAGGLLQDKKTINFVKRVGNESLLELISAQTGEEFMRTVVGYNPTTVRGYINDIIQLHTKQGDPSKIERKSQALYLQNVANDIFTPGDAIFYNRQLDTTGFRAEPQDVNVPRATTAVDSMLPEQERNIINQLSSVFNERFGANVIIDEESFASQMGRDATEITSSDGTVMGFVRGNDIYLNPSALRSQALVHEGMHLWYAVAKNNNPSVITRWNALAAEAIENDSVIGELFAEIKRLYSGMNLPDEELYEELLARLSEDVLEGVLARGNKTLYGKIRSFFKQILSGLSQMIKGKSLISLTPEELGELSMKDFVLLATRDTISPNMTFTTAESTSSLGGRIMTQVGDSSVVNGTVGNIVQPGLFDDTVRFSIKDDVSAKGARLGFTNKWDELIFERDEQLRKLSGGNYEKFMSELKASNEKFIKDIRNGKYTIKSFDDNFIRQEEQIVANMGMELQHNADSLKLVQESHQQSLNSWVSYLEQSQYPEGFKNHVMRELTSKVVIKGKIHKRLPTTATGYIPFNAEALARYNEDAKKGFFDQYPSILKEVTEKRTFVNESIKSADTDGRWIKFNQGSDHIALAGMCQGTGRCTATESYANSHLNGGDFYIFVTKGPSGSYDQPRIAIRNDDRGVAEVKGILDDQHLEGSMTSIAKEKTMSLPGGSDYEERLNNNALITRMAENPSGSYSADELRKLYEVDKELQTLGYNRDNRIDKVQEERNIREDMGTIFNVSPESVYIDIDIDDIDNPLLKGDISDYAGKKVFVTNNPFPFESLNALGTVETLIQLDKGGFMNISRLSDTAGSKLKTIKGDVYASRLPKSLEYIYGRLIIEDTFIDKGGFSNLKYVDEIIPNERNGTNATFDSLVSVGRLSGAFASENPFPKLKNVGQFAVENFGKLILPELEEVGFLRYSELSRYNPLLMPKLKKINSGFEYYGRYSSGLESNKGIYSLDMPSLEIIIGRTKIKTGIYEINFNNLKKTGPLSIDFYRGSNTINLPSLDNVNGNLSIDNDSGGNIRLEDVAPKLKSVSGNVFARNIDIGNISNISGTLEVKFSIRPTTRPENFDETMAFSDLSNAELKKGAMRVADSIDSYDSVDDIISTVQESDTITKVVIPNSFRFKDKDRIALDGLQNRAGEKVKLVYPLGERSFSFFIEDGNLYHGAVNATDKKYLYDLNTALGANLYYMDNVDNTNLYNAIIDMRFGDKAEVVRNYLNSTYPNDTLFQKIKRLEYASRINGGINKGPADLEGGRQSIQELTIKDIYDDVIERAGLESITLPEAIDETMLKTVYFNFTYSDSIQDKGRALNDLLIMFGYSESIVPEGYQAIAMFEDLLNSGYQVPFVSLQNVVDYFASGGKKNIKEFLNGFRLKNPTRFSDTTNDQVLLNALERAYDNTLFTTTMGDKDDWVVNTADRIVYENVSIDEISKLRAEMSLVPALDITQPINLDIETLRINQLVDEYYNQVVRLIDEGATEKQFYDLKREYQNLIYTYEQEYLVPRFGGYVKKEKRLYTAIFEVIKATNPDQLVTLRNQLDTIKQTHRAQIETVINIVEKIKKKQYTKAEIIDQLNKVGYYYTTDGTNLVKVTIDDLLFKSLADMPDSIGSLARLKDVQRSNIDNAEKVKRWRIIDAATKTRDNIVDPRDALYEKLFGITEGTMMNYSIINIDGVGEVPYILSVTNKTSMPYAQDKIIKASILKDIGKAFNENNELTEQQLREIVKKNLRTAEEKGFEDQYVRDFDFYTKLQAIPSGLLDEFANMNVVDDDIAQLKTLIGDVEIQTLRGEVSLDEALTAGPQSVIQKTLPSGVTPTALPINADPEFARRGRNLFYAYKNGLEEIPEIYTQIKSSVFNTAVSIIRGTDSLRLNKLADIGFLLASKAQVVSRLMNVQWGFRFGAGKLNRNYITQANLGIVQDIYNGLIDLGKGEFEDAIGKAAFDENFRMAYLIADYFRSLRAELRNITTNPQVNEIIENLPYLFGDKNRFGVSQLAAMGNQIRSYEILEMIDQADRILLGQRVATTRGGGVFRTVDPTLPMGKSGFVDEEGLKRFNQMFDANLTMPEYKYILMAYNRMKLGDYVSKSAAFINKLVGWTNRPLARAIISFPGSFMSIASSIITYSVSTKAYADMLGENIDSIRRSRTIRQSLGILVGEGSDATDLVKLNPGSTTPSLLDLYNAYTLSYGAAAERVIAPAIDNFHNGVDAAFAGFVKELSFINALRTNSGPLRFSSADEFDAWLKSNPDPALRKRVVDSITARSYELYRADTGMHPTAAEQPQMAGLLGMLLPLFNFRGARGLMMLRDVLEVFSNSGQMLQYIYRNGWSDATKANLETWLIANPKFNRFFETMFTAAYYSVKVEKALNGQDPIEERESDFVKNVVESFSQMSMRGAGLESNALSRAIGLNLNTIIGNSTQGVIGGAIYGYRNAEDFDVNKVQGLGGGALLGGIQEMQNSLLSQLRFIEPGRRLMSAYLNNGWDGFLQEFENVSNNISTGMARYNLDVLQMARGSDYLPRDRSPNYAIFGLNNTSNQSLRNELVLREKLAKYYLGTQNQRAEFLEKGDKGYTRENMKNSFFWSELANTGPVGRIVDAYLGGRLRTYIPDQGNILEDVYMKDEFVRSFLLENKLDVDLIQADKVEQSIDTIWFGTANFGVGKDSGNVRPSDIITSFLANKYDEPDLYMMNNDNIALDAIPEKTLREIMRIDNTAIEESQRNEAWRLLINELNAIPEDKKAFSSGIMLKIYMNREYDRKENEYKEAIKIANKSRPTGNKYTLTLPKDTQTFFKYEIIKSIQDRLVEIDRPGAQNIVNNIMAINNTDQLKELGIIDTIRYSNGDVRYNFKEGWDDYLGNVARLTTMVASGEPDAYLKTQSYFNNIGKYSGPDVQIAMLHRIRQFIDDRDMDTTDKISWKAGILEANRKLLFTKTEELRSKLGDDAVDAAMRYYYEFDDQLRDYVLDAYNREKTTGSGTGAGRGRMPRLPDFKAYMLPDRPKGDARVAKGVPVVSYHKTPGQLAKENPNPGPVSELRGSAISKPLFTTSEKVKDITRRIAKANVESFKFKKRK